MTQRTDDAIATIRFEVASLQADLADCKRSLAWYGEQARLCRLIHSEGDAGRAALSEDGGNRARSTLAKLDVKP